MTNSVLSVRRVVSACSIASVIIVTMLDVCRTTSYSNACGSDKPPTPVIIPLWEGQAGQAGQAAQGLLHHRVVDAVNEFWRFCPSGAPKGLIQRSNTLAHIVLPPVFCHLRALLIPTHVLHKVKAVSYTHLTLPTIYSV